MHEPAQSLQPYTLPKPVVARYWRFLIKTSSGRPTVWNTHFVPSVKAIKEWALFQGVIVELQIHNEQFYRVRSEGGGHKSYSASRFLVEFVENSVKSKVGADVPKDEMRDQIVGFVEHYNKGE